MKTMRSVFVIISALVAIGGRAQQLAEPLKLVGSIPMPDLHDGDFDHLIVDVPNHLLFAAAEENHAVVVIDLKSNKVVRNVSGVGAPHSLAYRPDLKKLFVVDGDDKTGAVKIFQGDSFSPAGSIKLREDADSSIFDPSTNYMYVVNGGSFISVIDTTKGSNLGDIKVDSESIEAMALEKSGPRMFANMYAKNAVAVIDRNKRSVVATWPIEQEGKKNAAMAFSEVDHRLFVVARDPGKVIVLNSDSGKILNSAPCIGNTDDAFYDPGSRRLYVAGVPSLDIFLLLTPNRFRQIGQLPSSFHGVTGTLVPEMNRYYLAVNHHGETPAQILIYEVVP